MGGVGRAITVNWMAMISFTSFQVDELLASLVSHNETIKVESEAVDLDIFLGPEQAWKLYRSLRQCLIEVELDHMGLTDEAKLAYGELEQWRAVVAAGVASGI